MVAVLFVGKIRNKMKQNAGLMIHVIAEEYNMFMRKQT